MASSNQPDPGADISAIRQDLKVLRSDVSALLKSTGESIGISSREVLKNGKAASETFYDDAKTVARDASGAAVHTLKSYPVTALAIAFAAGAACVALARRQ